MPEMKIYCFCNVRIEVDGQVIAHFDTDKARALLIYLAMQNEHPHPRTYLAGLFWSDQSEEQALHNLRQSLTSLRRTLGDAASSAPWLLVERETVQLNPEKNIWVDALAMQSGLAAAYRHYQRRDQAGWLNARQLIAALSLREGPFLAHLHLRGGPLFDEWQTLKREALDQLALQGLSLLLEIYERRGDYSLARQTAQRMIEIAPWDEQAHQQLMRLFALDGQRSAAQNQFRTLRRFLQEQLGVEPATETINLYEATRSDGHSPSSSLIRFPINSSRLPEHATTFLGREKELDEINELLANPACQLLTLFGPGGIGKTRLAVEIAREQVGVPEDGVFFVPLAAITSAGQLTAVIADALGLHLTDQSQPDARLLDYLREKRMLLVLDNFEQLLGTGQNLAPFINLVKLAPGIKWLVTSRERLLLQEEWVYSLAGMSYPRSKLEARVPVEQYDALLLFYRRANEVNYRQAPQPDWLEDAVQICQMLEGFPLGIELAAAAMWNHARGHVVQKIRQNLNAFDAPAVNAEPRHRNLWAAFDTSWQLLSAQEQGLFCRLAVFRGGFSLDAAGQVVGATAELLADLVNQSLVWLDLNGRYGMHEAVRQYADGKLREAEYDGEIRAAYASYYSAKLAAQSEGLRSSQQQKALAEIQVELSNILAAWDWNVLHQDIPAISAGIDPLYQFYNIHSRFAEGIALFQRTGQILERGRAEQPAQNLEMLLGMIYARTGSLAHYSRQNDLALQELERALEIFNRLECPSEAAFCRASLGGVYLRAKEFSQALTCGEKNLAYYREMNDIHGENRALYLLGLIHNRLGKIKESRRYFTAAVEVARRSQEPRRLMAPLNMLGDIACSEGDYAEAESLFRQSLQIARDLNDLYYQAILLNNLADAYHFNHQYERAQASYQDSLAICREIGDRDGEAVALNNLGELAVYEENYAQAIGFSQQALKIARQIGEEWTITVCLNNLGEACNGIGKAVDALQYLTEAIRLAVEIDACDMVARFSVNAGRSFQLQGFDGAAEEIFRAVLAHPAAEHDTREKAGRWHQEMGAGQETVLDQQALAEVVTRLILKREEK